MTTENKNPILWEASSQKLEASLLWSFKNEVQSKRKLTFINYNDLHRWSVEHYQDFWLEFLLWSKIVYDGDPSKVFVPNPSHFYGGSWFPDLSLNYAENLLSNLADKPLRSFYENNHLIAELDRSSLLTAVKSFQDFFISEGLLPGDRVAAFVGNNHLALIAMLAVTSLGGVWASCSPDFGEQGVLDRFTQINPKFFLYAEKSIYNGKTFLLNEKVEKISQALKNVDSYSLDAIYSKIDFSKQKTSLSDLIFKRQKFSSPLYILFSSGTTGAPKCIVHSVGGTLLQHAKEHLLHCDLKKNERFTYYTTTGWMMWNWMVSGLFAGAEVFTLEGSPLTEQWSMWDFVKEQKINVFGTSAKFISTCRSRTLQTSLPDTRLTLSTGSPLLPEDFDYYYSVIDPQKKTQLASISGGTDIVSCFMLGNPWSPVRRGEIQAAGLGMHIDSLDENSNSIRNSEGELVCKTVFPSMPTEFYNDLQNKKFEEAYFSKYPNLWYHGDFITISSEGGIQVHGRSDTTLNPAGVRIGTAEIYRVVEQDNAVMDSLVVGKVIDGDEKVVLFLKLKAGDTLTEDLKKRLKAQLKAKASPRHVPDYIFAVNEIPYTLSGKKVELAVKKLLKGEAPKNTEALQNPLVLEEYRGYSLPQVWKKP